MRDRPGRGRRCLLLAIGTLSLVIAGQVQITAVAATAGHAIRPVERVPSVRERAYMDALTKMGLPVDGERTGMRK